MFSTLASSRRRKSTGIRSMFPQSRNTRTRSTTSIGGSWNTSLRGRNRYSTGSGNSLAARNITESLPSCRRISCVPRSEPSASPSGPSCVVSRKRSSALSSAATSASEASLGSDTVGAASLIEQARDPNAALRRLVVVEREGRGALDPRLASDRCLEHAVGRAESGQRRLPLGILAQHADVDPRGAEVRACLDGGHGGEANPWVLELGGDRCPDHFAHELVDPPYALGHSGATIAMGPKSAGRLQPRISDRLSRSRSNLD